MRSRIKSVLAIIMFAAIIAGAQPVIAQSAGPLEPGEVQYVVTPDGYIWRCVGTQGGGISCNRQGRIGMQ